MSDQVDCCGHLPWVPQTVQSAFHALAELYIKQRASPTPSASDETGDGAKRDGGDDDDDDEHDVDEEGADDDAADEDGDGDAAGAGVAIKSASKKVGSKMKKKKTKDSSQRWQWQMELYGVLKVMGSLEKVRLSTFTWLYAFHVLSQLS